jgi:hypothetical protein
MEALVINGFTFPNNLQARQAITHICAAIIRADKPRWEGDNPPGYYRYDWKYNHGGVYNTSTLNGPKRHLLADYFERKDRSELSGDNKIWDVRSDSVGYIKPNEWTHVVANMSEEISAKRKENQAQGREYRIKQIQKIFKHHELQVGDIVKFNPKVFDLSWNQAADVDYPDAQYTKGVRKYDPAGKIIIDMNVWRSHSVDRWGIRGPGVLLGFDQVTFENGAQKTAAIVMYSEKPYFFDPRVLMKA